MHNEVFLERLVFQAEVEDEVELDNGKSEAAVLISIRAWFLMKPRVE